MNQTSLPIPLAVVICDHIWRDPYSGKVNLLGTFNAIASVQFPLVQPALSVYVALTEGHGPLQFRIRLIDVDDALDPIFEFEGEVFMADPRVVGEIEFARMNVTFPAPGEYRLQFFVNGEFLTERRLMALQMQSGPPPASH